MAPNNSFKPTAGVGQPIKQPFRAGGGLILVLGVMNTYHRYKELGRPIDYLMECWARGWSSDPIEKAAHDWACMEPVDDARGNPERAWQCILYALDSPSCAEHFDVLAAGPLEDLLSHHGAGYIDRVEALAKENPKFAWLLGGVWRFQMSDEVWDRVQKAWDRRGWDGIPNDA